MRSYGLALTLGLVVASLAPAGAIDLDEWQDCQFSSPIVPDNNDSTAAETKSFGLENYRTSRHDSFRNGEVTVDVHVHIVGRPKEAQGKKKEFLLTQSDVNSQMQVLNEKFRPANISFRLVGVDWTVSPLLPAYKDGLKDVALEGNFDYLLKGDASALNIYFVNTTRGVNGIYFAQENSPYRTVYVASDTKVGGSHPLNNLGIVTVHEVGHWLGLNTHTSTGRECLGSYKALMSSGHSWDYVAQHVEETDLRCDPRPSCRNYMASHVADSCRVEFNSTQMSFMRFYAQDIKQGKSPPSWSSLQGVILEPPAT